MHQQLLLCLKTMMEVGQSDIMDVSQIIFNIIITVIALKQTDSTAEEVGFRLLITKILTRVYFTLPAAFFESIQV